MCCHTYMHLRGLDLVIQVQVYVTMRGNEAQLVADYIRRVRRGVLSDVENYRSYDLMDPKSQETGESSGESRQPVAGPSTAPDRPVVAVRYQEAHGEAFSAAQQGNQDIGSPTILVPETDSDPEGEPSEGSTVAAPVPGDLIHDVSVESIITILSDSTLPSIIGPTEGDTSSVGGNGEEELVREGVREEEDDFEREEAENVPLQQEEGREGEASGLSREEEEGEEIRGLEGEGVREEEGGEERQEEEEVELGREEGESSRTEGQETEESEEEVSAEQVAIRREVMAQEWAIMERMDAEEEEQRKRMLEEGLRRRMRRRLMDGTSGSDDDE